MWLRIVTRMGPGQALGSALAALRCPVCEGALRLDVAQTRCPNKHSFDVARQGYLNLTTGGTQARTADTAAMVAARQSFLGAGHYRRIADELTRVLAEHDAPDRNGLVVDLGGGTGYYLAAVLDALPDRIGVCVDLSAPALRRAARAHPRVAAVAADVWGRLPLADGAASSVLNVFAPRDADEIERVLSPGGTLVVATPESAHLQELIEPLGLLTVDPRKADRLTETFRRFQPIDRVLVSEQLRLAHRDIENLVGMGPSAAHVDAPEMADRIGRLTDPTAVTVAVHIAIYASPPKERREGQ